jgi:asparagine synthetase B (glutamine-hydrolysing)
MCGIFGLVRNPGALCPEVASDAFVLLGELSVERGRDAAGFALSRCARTDATAPGTAIHGSAEAFLDEMYVAKACAPFTDLWDDDAHGPLLDDAVVALGHTRWATQGAKDALVNASPLVGDRVVGTHNGDLDMTTIPAAGRRMSVGTTDTEAFFRALDPVVRDRRQVKDLLAAVVGRAALAWVDRGRQDKVFLARGGLSPLAVAWDADGNFWWASNPRWFRDIDEALDGAVGFRDIRLVREGTLLTVAAGNGVPQVEDERTFVPTVRQSDERTASVAAWRWFDDEDERADKAQANHKVAKPAWSYTSSRPATGGGTSAGRAKKKAGRPAGPARPVTGGALEARLGAETPDVLDALDTNDTNDTNDNPYDFRDPFYSADAPDPSDPAFQDALRDAADWEPAAAGW